jgi:hypothetical protein
MLPFKPLIKDCSAGYVPYVSSQQSHQGRWGGAGTDMKLKRRIVSSVMAGLMLATIATASQAAEQEPAVEPTATAAACVVTAKTPYSNSQGRVYWSGTHSGCSGNFVVQLSWSLAGPDQTLEEKWEAGNGATYSRYCNWPVPYNRNLYTTARIYNGVRDTSSISTFTSSTSNCRL